MLKRKLYDELCSWKKKSQGKTAMLIDGARRVGKSYIAESFARNEYKSHIIIDFGNAPQDILDLFLHESADLDLFFSKLSAFYGTILPRRESLIVFDEVQQFPRARQLIKYFVADGRYDFLETGSLIRLKKNTEDIIIPSEEEHLEMFPLDFEEFLWAMGDEATFPLIRQCFETKTPLGQALHRKVMNDFRQYVLVGGMPQSVLAYREERDFAASDEAKRRILKLYRDDVSKFAGGYEEKVYAVFDGIPGQLSKKEKRYTLSSIDRNARFRAYEDSFVWLNEAMVINACYNTTDPNIGLALSADHAEQKCYMADTGLLVTHTFMDSAFTDNELYKAILFDRLDINEGMIMENIVAQILRQNGHRLYFYSRNDNRNRENHMEIDFLIAEGKKISPLEVKSAKYRSHASLDKFRKKFSKTVGTPYILYPNDVMQKDGIWHLPLYMTVFL
ncbi:MAG: AAA family ATPase [Bacteroidales bacterium]|nr:AAA family ATPase [Bacteroidales bacterium]MCM1415189.1 AAA family ATPase [bacterium]MCM1424894.1 AAA family ATPase [bacterium]